jgi:hypothetical protein
VPCPEGTRLVVVHVAGEDASATSGTVGSLVVFRAAGAGAATGVPPSRKADYNGESLPRSGPVAPLWTLPGMLPVRVRLASW